jgi:hypothetical protein
MFPKILIEQLSLWKLNKEKKEYLGKPKLTKNVLEFTLSFQKWEKIKTKQGQMMVMSSCKCFIVVIMWPRTWNSVIVRILCRNTFYNAVLIKLCKTVLPLCLALHWMHACLPKLEYGKRSIIGLPFYSQWLAKVGTWDMSMA